MTDFWRRIPRQLLIRIVYLVVGLKLGALWLAQGDSSPAEHALRLLILMAVVMAVATGVRRWREHRGHHVTHHPIGRFLLVKVALLAGAMLAGLALDGWIADADLWVAIGMGAAVAFGGPLIHPWLMKQERDTAQVTHNDTMTAAPVAL